MKEKLFYDTKMNSLKEKQVEMIREAIRNQDLKRAYRYVKNYLGRYPNDLWAIFKYGQVLHWLNCDEVACFYLKQLFETKMEISARVTLFSIFLSHRDYEEAYSYVADILPLIENRKIIKKINLVQAYLHINQQSEIKNPDYDQSQYYDYNRQVAVENFQSFVQRKFFKTKDNFEPQLFFKLVEDKLTRQQTTFKLPLEDVYYFYYPNMIYKGEYRNYLRVVTLPDSFKILKIVPCALESIPKEVSEISNLLENKTKRLSYRTSIN